MASDSRISHGAADKAGSADKIVRCPETGTLAGACGDLSAMAAFHEWFLAGQEDAFPLHRKESFDGIIVTQKGKVFYIDVQGRRAAVSAPYHAIGSGAFYALGAMFHGATADQAVKAAIRFDGYSEGPIKALHLNT